MCSISASFNAAKLNELIKLNAYRGAINHSISVFGSNLNIAKYEGPVKETVEVRDKYVVVHQQAPTSNIYSEIDIHPAEHGSYFLWHNGILKEEYLKRLQNEVNCHHTWDTHVMLVSIILKGFECLGEIDGSFACLMYDEKMQSLFAFRNEISPLFYDNNLNISSTKFDNSIMLPANEVFLINIDKRSLKSVFKFTTKDNPYVFSNNQSSTTTSSTYQQIEDFDPYA